MPKKTTKKIEPDGRGMVMYMHCNECPPEKEILVIGLTPERVLRIGCDGCNRVLGEFELVDPPEIQCAYCDAGIPHPEGSTH